MADQDTTDFLDGLAIRPLTTTNAVRASSIAEAPAPQIHAAIPSLPTPALEFRGAPEFDRTAADRPMRQHLLFHVAAPARQPSLGVGTCPQEAAPAPRSPVNLCLCLDRSGSMEGDPLAYAKRACCQIADMLGDRDTLSAVTFAEQPELLFSAQKGADRETLKRQISRISVGNRTNLYGGLEAALDLVFDARTVGSLNRIFLLSDGEPTAGTKDFQSIVTLVTDRRRDAIRVSGLGFGPAYNEELIAALARRSGGNYYYIARPEMLPDVFAVELEGLMQTAARDIKLHVSMPEGIELRQVYSGDVDETARRAYEIGLVDLGWGESVSSLWEVEIAPHRPGRFRVCAARLEYRECATFSRRQKAADVVVEFSSDADMEMSDANPKVRNEREFVMAAQQLDQTMLLMRTRSATARDALANLERTHKLLANCGQSEQARNVQRAIAGIQSGQSVEKTLIGAIMPLGQGRRG